MVSGVPAVRARSRSGLTPPAPLTPPSPVPDAPTSRASDRPASSALRVDDREGATDAAGSAAAGDPVMPATAPDAAAGDAAAAETAADAAADAAGAMLAATDAAGAALAGVETREAGALAAGVPVAEPQAATVRVTTTADTAMRAARGPGRRRRRNGSCMGRPQARMAAGT